MQTKLYLISGLPGSGKSSYAQQEVAKAMQNGLRVYFLDDPLCDVDDDTPPNDARRLFGAPEQAVSFMRALACALDKGADEVYVACPFLCETVSQNWTLNELRARSLYDKFDIHWVQFENNLSQCKKNAKRRGNFYDVQDFMYELAGSYAFRPDAVVLPVWAGCDDQ